MSVEASSWAWAQDIPPTEKYVLLALADRSGDFQDCYPSVKDIVQRTGLGESTIRGATGKLADRKLIDVVHRTGEGGRKISSIYRLHLDTAHAEKLAKRVAARRERERLHKELDSAMQPPLPHLQQREGPAINVAHPPLSAGPTYLQHVADYNQYKEPEEDSPATEARVNPDRNCKSHANGTAAAAPEWSEEARKPAPPVPPAPPPPGSRWGDDVSAQGGYGFPADWSPTPADREYATSAGFDPDDLAEDFRLYWRSRPPALAISSDWSLNWQRWVRKEVKMAGARRPSAPDAAYPAGLSASPARPAATPRVPNLEARIPDPELREAVLTNIRDPSSGTLWAWAAANPRVTFGWNTDDPHRPPTFTEGQGYLDGIITDLLYKADIWSATARDFETAAAWMHLAPQVFDAIDVAGQVILDVRRRWKGDRPPYSLRLFDQQVRSAIAERVKNNTERSARIAALADAYDRAATRQ